VLRGGGTSKVSKEEEEAGVTPTRRGGCRSPANIKRGRSRAVVVPEGKSSGAP